MKNILNLSFLVIVVLSCSSTRNATNDPLHGKWSLTNYSVFMAIDENYEYPAYDMGDVVWDFDSNKSIIKVIKRFIDQPNDFSPADGQYDYTYVNGVFKMNGLLYDITLQDNTLVIDSNTDPRLSRDAPVLSFIRMNNKK